MTDADRYKKLKAWVQSQVPQFKVAFKDQSRFMKFIGFFISIFNPGFMENYTITIGYTVYFPNAGWETNTPTAAFDVLSHEMMHMIQRRRDGMFHFVYSYLMPQLLVVFILFAFGAFWNLWALCFLACLLALIPWPSPGRVDAEVYAYTMTMAVQFWRTGHLGVYDYSWIADDLAGRGYYWATWNKTALLSRLGVIADKIKRGDFSSQLEYVVVKSYIES